MGTVETVPFDEALLDGGVTKVVWRAPSINGLSLSFCPLTQSLVLDKVEVAVDVGVDLDDPVPDDKTVEWVNCEETVEGELYTLTESLCNLLFGGAACWEAAEGLCTGLLENWPE